MFFLNFILTFCYQISVKFAKIIPEELNISGANAKHRSTLIQSKIIIDNPGANFINEFTKCFCLKNIVRSSYVKNRVSTNYSTLRTSYFFVVYLRQIFRCRS